MHKTTHGKAFESIGDGPKEQRYHPANAAAGRISEIKGLGKTA
jgi:hypothetical protein